MAILCHNRIKKTIRQDTFYWYNNSFVDAKHSHGKVLFSTVTPAAGHKYTVGLLHVRDKLARNYWPLKLFSQFLHIEKV